MMRKGTSRFEGMIKDVVSDHLSNLHTSMKSMCFSNMQNLKLVDCNDLHVRLQHGGLASAHDDYL